MSPPLAGPCSQSLKGPEGPGTPSAEGRPTPPAGTHSRWQRLHTKGISARSSFTVVVC